MEVMTIEDFKNLKFGDRIIKIRSNTARNLRYVGRMPSSPDNYFIFSDGEHLEHFHISKNASNYHKGEYDPKYIGRILIEGKKKEIQDIEDIFLTD